MSTIAIILPAYNEEKTIASTIRDFHSELEDATYVIVNNASSDNTAEEAQKALSELSAKGFVINEMRPGKGNALRRGFKSIEADIYVVADADMTYPAKHIHDLIEPIEHNRADLVVGDRITQGHYKQENKRPFHNLGNKLVVSIVNRIFKSKLNDIMSGYRVLSRSFVENYPILVEGFQIETDMTLYALDKRFRILEIPVEYRDRPEGSDSKLNTFSDGARVLMTIVSIFRHYRPLVFFGAIAILLSILSLYSSIPVFEDWIEHRYIYHLPLAILASGLALLASLSFSLGLILDSIVFQHRMGLEREIKLSNPMRKNGKE